jgi:uncharacterized membrane protein HdeD (DUF308 family)
MTSQTGASRHRPGEFASGAARSNMMSAALAQNWWAMAIRGVAAILFGIVALLLPGVALLSFVILFSAYMLVDGVFAIVAAVRAIRRHERWGLLVLEGVASLAAAAVAFVLPGLTVAALVILVAAWSLVTGSLELFAAFHLNRDHGQIWLIIGGAASMLLGLLLIIAPLIGAIVLTWWIGAYAIVFGVTLCALAFRLRLKHQDHPHTAAAAGA